MYNGNGIWIPYEILQNDELTSTEKILYAEIYYLDRPDEHCTASNEHLAQFLKISEAGVKKCLTHLRELGYIHTVAFDGRKRSIATNVKWRDEVDTPVSSREIQESPSEGYKNEFLLYRENKIENSRESTLPGALAKHPRNFSKQTLTDDLQSGKDIDEQKKEKKKVSEYDKCVEEINKRYENTSIHILLLQHLDWSYHSKDPQRIRSLKTYKRRLDELDKLNDLEGSIKQSISKQWHCFYDVAEQKSRRKNTPDNTVVSKQQKKDVNEILAQRAERQGII